jgi:PKD repeat protein
VAAGSRYTFTADAQGEHELEVRVSDGSHQATRSWTINVVPDALRPPSAALALSPDSGSAPLQVRIRGSASDPDGSVLRYDLDADGDGIFELSGPDAPDVTRSFTSPGTFRLKLRVMDDDSLTTLAEGMVRVKANQPPHADLAVTPSEGPAPLAARVRAAGSDPDGAIALYELDLDGDGRYELSRASAADTTVVFDDYSQPVTVALRVTDANGAADVARVTVRALPDVDPSASQVTQDGTGRLLSDGEASRGITVRVVDGQGRALSGVGVELASSRNGGALGTVDRMQPDRGTTDASGRFTAQLRTSSSSTLLGDAVIRATAGGRQLGSTVTVQFVTPVNTFNSSLTCPFSAVHVRSSRSEPREAVVVAQVRNVQNRPLPGMYVELETRDAALFPVQPPGGRSDANGVFRASITSDRANETTFVDFYADGHKTSAICVVGFVP